MTVLTINSEKEALEKLSTAANQESATKVVFGNFKCTPKVMTALNKFISCATNLEIVDLSKLKSVNEGHVKAISEIAASSSISLLSVLVNKDTPFSINYSLKNKTNTKLKVALGSYINELRSYPEACDYYGNFKGALPKEIADLLPTCLRNLEIQKILKSDAKETTRGEDDSTRFATAIRVIEATSDDSIAEIIAKYNEYKEYKKSKTAAAKTTTAALQTSTGSAASLTAELDEDDFTMIDPDDARDERECSDEEFELVTVTDALDDAKRRSPSPVPTTTSNDPNPLLQASQPQQISPS